MNDRICNPPVTVNPRTTPVTPGAEAPASDGVRFTQPAGRPYHGSWRASAVLAIGLALGLTSAAADAISVKAEPSEPYTWRSVVIGGGGFVTGIIFHPREKGLVYARTDVGGAYRWDAPARRWVPLNDWVGEADANLMGIESFAVDPNHPQRLYLAAGTYTGRPAAILRSDDQGRTFQRTDVSFRMGANEAGRFNGERLAVDPHQGDILFFGSRRDGLWKSADRGATWRRVESFTHIGAEEPAAATGTTNTTRRRRNWGFGGEQPVGIIAVVFDRASGKPGAPTPALYAAVSAPQTNLYRSTDGGASWEAVPGQPVGLRPNHLVRSPDGLLYLSYGREPGPNTMTDGAIWKCDPKDDRWTNITPVDPSTESRGFGYGCVAVDAQHPATIMATTFCRWSPHDEIFRSTNGGASWIRVWQTNTTVWDHSSAPYTETRTPHWMGTIAINPLDPGQVLFTTGYGIWCCNDVTAADSDKPTRWVFLDPGLEETVPLALLSPPTGAHLISGVGDIDGFRHDDVDVSPAEGSFAGPRFSTTRDLAFAADKPETLVRIGNGGRDVSAHAAISEDGGKSWKTFESDPPGGGSGQGRIALSADGQTLVWAVQRGETFVTPDRGATWHSCEGISSAVNVLADPVDAARFYAYDAEAGRLLVSTNSARTFAAAPARLPGTRNVGRGGVVLTATPGLPGDVWIGSRGIGLYHSTDGGASFAKLDGLQGADALGFGKAAPGKTFPAIYLRGRIDGLYAFYRSDDAGRTWVRINDDQHQFGAADRPMTVGDPRIYGRVYLTTGGRGIIYGEPALNGKER